MNRSLALLLFALDPTCALADDLVAPFDANYPPLSFRGRGGAPDGYDVAVAKEVARRLDSDVAFEPADFFEIQSGDWPPSWDYSVASMSRNPDREDRFLFVGPYVYDQIVVVAALGSPVEEVQQLRDVEVGVCDGCIYHLFLEGEYESDGVAGKALPGVDAVTFATDPDILREISDPNSGLEFGVTSAFHADYFISLGAPIKKLTPPLFVSPLWIVVPKGMPDIAEAISVAVEEMRADGTLPQLSVDYLGSDYTGP